MNNISALSGYKKCLFSIIVLFSISIAFAGLLVPSYELGVRQQTTTTVNMNTQSFGCNGGTCSLGGVQTNTIVGITTTYTVGSSTVTFVQEGSTWTASMFLTLTQSTLAPGSTSSQSVDPMILVGVTTLAAVCLAAAFVYKTLLKGSKIPSDPSDAQVRESIPRLSERGVVVRNPVACPACGHLNPPYAERFCVKCGKQMSSKAK